ncbi:hypothetical protein ES705_30504 [subsurface metagenome]
MRFIPDAKLWVIGSGDIVKKLKKMVSNLDLDDQIKFFGRITLENLWDYTSRADIGISLEEDLGLNYQYALPNKLFDYIQARIPVVISDLPEMKEIVEKYAIGKILNERTPHKLADLIKGMIKDELSKGVYNTNLELAARELCWEREEDKLITLFRHVNNST